MTTPSFAPVACKNAFIDLEGLLPAVLASPTFHLAHYDRICLLYRRMAVGSLLSSGDPKGFFAYLVCSTRAFVHFAEHAPISERLTSKAVAFLDGVACRDQEGARRIAEAMPRQPTVGREYEEDFYALRILMDLYLGATDEASLVQMLDAWRALAENGSDPRLDVCSALVRRDQSALEESIVVAVAAMQSAIAKREKMSALPADEAATTAHVSTEVLAWLEMAERRGLTPPWAPALAPALARAFHRLGPPSSESWRSPR